MKYIIIEDEKIAAERLKRLIAELRPDYKHVITLDSVETAVISLTALKADLYFMDIQLADGLSFEIFDQVAIEKPIIFTTAYDNYAIQAFKQNSVDYLLKPIDEEGLLGAIEKYEKYASQPTEVTEGQGSNYTDLVSSFQPKGKERFIVKLGDHLKNIPSVDVQLFYSQDKMTYLLTKDGQSFPIDYSLDKVENLVAANDFFRISRRFIINMDYINDIVAYTNSRLEVKVNHYKGDQQVIVARERVNDFKKWLDR